MNREEFIELQKKNKEDESKMSAEEKKALKEAQRRHSRKVRDEIVTSFEINKKKGKTDNT